MEKEKDSMKILIAEDDVISCRVLANNIKGWGYDVAIAKNGEEAWEALFSESNQVQQNGNSRIRMAILDWEMPRINGIELCRRIRDRAITQPQDYIYVILLTGRDLQEDIIEGLSAGADDYMTKPFDQVELKIRLKNGERILKQESQQLELTSIDSLTKLWNRNKILDFLDDEMARSSRQNQPTGVLMVDTGGQVENIALPRISEILQKTVRRYDKAGRYTDKEFLIVLPNCRKDHITHIAERLRREFMLIDIHVSMGGTSSEYCQDCQGDSLIRTAESALTKAKEDGENQAIIIDPKR